MTYEFSPYYCYGCGCRHRGFRCAPGPQTVVMSPSVPSSSPIQRCPVCEGCGSVPCDFYTRLGVATGTNRETCRTCRGDGIISTATGQPAAPSA